MGGSSCRRWRRRVVVATAVVGAVAALRERQLRRNARRYGL